MKDTEHAVFLVYYAVKGATVQGQRRQNRVRLFKHKRARFDPFP